MLDDKRCSLRAATNRFSIMDLSWVVHMYVGMCDVHDSG